MKQYFAGDAIEELLRANGDVSDSRYASLSPERVMELIRAQVEIEYIRKLRKLEQLGWVHERRGPN